MKTKGLDKKQLQLLAIAAMVVDHTAWGFVDFMTPLGQVMHLFGRLTLPIMCFFIAEGFHYTRNVKKYIGRLFVFAFISHFAYNFAGGIPFIPNRFFNMTSVMWSLAWSVVLMVIFTTEHLQQWMKIVLISLIY